MTLFFCVYFLSCVGSLVTCWDLLGHFAGVSRLREIGVVRDLAITMYKKVGLYVQESWNICATSTVQTFDIEYLRVITVVYFGTMCRSQDIFTTCVNSNYLSASPDMLA